jgi:hypothetical protein
MQSATGVYGGYRVSLLIWVWHTCYMVHSFCERCISLFRDPPELRNCICNSSRRWLMRAWSRKGWIQAETGP